VTENSARSPRKAKDRAHFPACDENQATRKLSRGTTVARNFIDSVPVHGPNSKLGKFAYRASLGQPKFESVSHRRSSIRRRNASTLKMKIAEDEEAEYEKKHPGSGIR